jgi:hypothetical protein
MERGAAHHHILVDQATAGVGLRPSTVAIKATSA